MSVTLSRARPTTVAPGWTVQEVSMDSFWDQQTLVAVLRRHAWLVTVAASAVTGLAAGILGGVRSQVALPSATLILAVLVIAAAATGIRRAGYAAAVAASAGFAFFLTTPYGTLKIDNAEDIEVATMLLIVGAVVTEITQWGRREQARASRGAGYLDGLLQATEVTARGTQAPGAYADLLLSQIVSVLGAETAAVVSGPCPCGPDTVVMQRDGSLTLGATVLDASSGLPTNTEVHVALPGEPSTHLEITSALHHARPTLEQRRVALALADHLPPL